MVLVDVAKTPALAVNHTKLSVMFGCCIDALRMLVASALSYPGFDKADIYAWSTLALSQLTGPFPSVGVERTE